MRKTLILAAIMILAASVAFAAVSGTKHDLRLTGGGTATGNGLTEICVVCHTPHQATAASKQDPLWNHTGTSTATFAVYASATMNATPSNIASGSMGTFGASMLCMSCHDGTVSVLSMYNPPNTGTPTPVAIGGRINASGLIIGNANLGTDLSDDHPVNFAYDAALVGADGELQPVATVTAAGLLIGTQVQCASCHDVHNNTNAPFLRYTNAGSALCLQCHIK